MKKTVNKTRLAAVFVNENAAKKLQEIGDKEKRTMANQAAYIIEAWAQTAK